MNKTISYESKVRTSIKSLIWRLVGVIVLGLVTYFYTRAWCSTTWITALHHGLFFFIFILHERFWFHVDYTGLKRKLFKMLTYETILGNFILGIITLIITGDIQQMTQITLTYIVIKHIIYIFNEFIWDKITWGRK